uniref:SFRICE_035705 n=1 Tax=Spodoptera frugiperda TaxID=7108 RepID=A0A2H1WMN8_SPOFR
MNGFKTKKYTKKSKITGVLTAIKVLKLRRDIDHSKEKNQAIPTSNDGVSYSFFSIPSYILEQVPNFTDRETDGQFKSV